MQVNSLKPIGPLPPDLALCLPRGRERPEDTMRRQFVIALALLVALLRSTNALAGTITLAWDPNPEGDIGGYRIAYGTAAGSHPTVVDVGNRVSYQLRGLTDGQR